MGREKESVVFVSVQGKPSARPCGFGREGERENTRAAVEVEAGRGEKKRERGRRRASSGFEQLSSKKKRRRREEHIELAP